jgi:predicted outer membrane protein
MNVRKLVALSLCGVGLSVASLAMAQQVVKKGSEVPQAPGQAGQRTQLQNTDHMLATCVAIGNQEEVAIAKFAADKAQHKDVKEFAAMLVKDHRAFNQKLQKYAPEATQDGYLMEKDATTVDGDGRTSSAKPKAPTSGSSSIQQTSATKENSEGQPLDLVQLHRELAEECIQSAKMGMSKKDKSEFDECFIGYQIAMHAGMKNKLTVFERHASGDLKQVLVAGIETTEKHMQKAEQIMKKLASADSSTAKKDRSDDSK